MNPEPAPGSELPFPRFRKGETTLEIHGRVHVIVGLTKWRRHLLVQDEETGEPDTLSPDQFWQLYEHDDLTIDDHAFDQLPERFRSALDQVEPTITRDGWASFRRFKYLVAADRAGASKTDKGLQPVIDQVAKEIGDSEDPDPKTLATWMRTRGKPGQRFARFMRDRDDLKGRTDWLGDEQDLITEETIELYYKNKRQLRPNEIIEAVRGEIAKRNKALRIELKIEDATYNALNKNERKKLGFLIEPHPSTIARRIERHEGYETKKLRDGKKDADADYIGVDKPPPIAKHANHVWYIDHTRLDGHLAYNGKTKLPMGRPWLTVVVDAYSRLIVGFYVGYIPPSIHSVALALKNAIKSKNYVREKYPSIDRLWLSVGLPDVVVVDRALEFTGSSFEMACAQLAIEVVWCPRKTPRWKGIVERTIRTINTNFVELLPGSTKGDARKLTKQERDPSAEAEISCEELKYNFHKWVIAVYPRKTHSGLEDRPGDVYERSIREKIPRVPAKALGLAVLGMVFWRTLDRKGIQFLHRRYCDKKKVSAMLIRAKKPKVRVLFMVDPDSLREIVVSDPTTGERVVLPCRVVLPWRDEDTSLWEHRNVLKWMRSKSYDLADQENWLIAKKEIRDSMMARLLNPKTKLRSRARAAREARIGEESRTNLTILNELYSDGLDEQWLMQEFVKADRVFPSDDDEPVVAGGDANSSEAQRDAGMSQFGRRTRRPKTGSKSRSRRLRATGRSKPTKSEQEVQISDEEAAEAHREHMAAFKRPNLNRR